MMGIAKQLTHLARAILESMERQEEFLKRMAKLEERLVNAHEAAVARPPRDLSAIPSMDGSEIAQLFRQTGSTLRGPSSPKGFELEEAPMEWPEDPRERRLEWLQMRAKYDFIGPEQLQELKRLRAGICGQGTDCTASSASSGER